MDNLSIMLFVLLIPIIRSYLGYVIVIDMISKRLTKNEKNEILEAYRGGENSNTIAENYSCSLNTVNRTVRSLISADEYKFLKEKRLKSGSKKIESVSNKIAEDKQSDFGQQNPFDNSQIKVNEQDQSIKTENDIYNFATEAVNQDIDNKFEEIVPLISDFDFERKELDFEILNQENLPDSVYMLVDKKVELEVKSISDLPEWSFLPENELKRNAILLFLNQRSAKRSCSRSQRVIKIPNTRIFEVTKSYLVSKGITRLILEDSIIALAD